MHKSAITIGLFLMASLIMVSTVAAIPIGNMNLFSNAMASEKNSNKNDNSQKYESYYSDNNDKYRANYEDNYYYQQQDQPQPSYDNGYNDKKISYNNSYEDMKKYSTYPTKDNKIACQTGHFEGFFVESVEFCKLKIAQGPQGPQGPQGLAGPIGATGPIGPQGITQLVNGTNVYLVTNTTSTTNVSVVNLNAVCQPGDFVLNGGYSYNNATLTPFSDIAENQPITTPSGAGWQVSAQSFSAITLTVNAYCFNNSP